MLVSIVKFTALWIGLWLIILGAAAVVFAFPWFVIVAIPLVAQLTVALFLTNIRAFWPGRKGK